MRVLGFHWRPNTLVYILAPNVLLEIFTISDKSFAASDTPSQPHLRSYIQ